MKKIVLNLYFSWTVNSDKYSVLPILSSIRNSCVFYLAGDWDDLQIDLHASLHVGFKIQFAGIVPVFLEFNGENTLPAHGGKIENSDDQLRIF